FYMFRPIGWRLPSSPLFPYLTLFRSASAVGVQVPPPAPHSETVSLWRALADVGAGASARYAGLDDSRQVVRFMQGTETLSDGLKRQPRVVGDAGEIGATFDARLDEIKDMVQLKGFREGKVPVQHLKQVFGRTLMGEVLQQATEEKSRAALDERKERPAIQPQIDLPEDQQEIEKVMSGQADLSFGM